MLGSTEIFIIAGIVVLLFGAGAIPKFARSIGKAKNEFQKDNFHRAYRADELDGDLILKPDNFMTPSEKSAGENSFVYVSEPRGILYYSGYTDNSSKQRDIFKEAHKVEVEVCS